MFLILRRAQIKIKNSEWEKVLFADPLSGDDRDMLADFRKKDAAIEDCIRETNEMIDTGTIPPDQLWATRNRIRDIKADLENFEPEERMAQLRLLMELHLQVFEGKKKQDTIEAVPTYIPDDGGAA